LIHFYKRFQKSNFKMHKVGQIGKLLVSVPKNQLQILSNTEASALTAVRFQSAQAEPSAAALERQKKKEKAMQKKAVHSKSFAQNIFRGMVESEQVFPYPIALDEEQKENLDSPWMPLGWRLLAAQICFNLSSSLANSGILM